MVIYDWPNQSASTYDVDTVVQCATPKWTSCGIMTCATLCADEQSTLAHLCDARLSRVLVALQIGHSLVWPGLSSRQCPTRSTEPTTSPRSRIIAATVATPSAHAHARNSRSASHTRVHVARYHKHATDVFLLKDMMVWSVMTRSVHCKTVLGISSKFVWNCANLTCIQCHSDANFLLILFGSQASCLTKDRPSRGLDVTGARMKLTLCEEGPKDHRAVAQEPPIQRQHHHKPTVLPSNSLTQTSPDDCRLSCSMAQSGSKASAVRSKRVSARVIWR